MEFKLSIPAAQKNDNLFNNALKVCIAISVFDQENVEIVGCAGQNYVSLECPKQNKSLNEANSIVRYAFKKVQLVYSDKRFLQSQNNGQISVSDAALIEWEETFLYSNLLLQDKQQVASSVEKVLSIAEFPADFSTAAAIIVMATLYEFIPTFSSTQLQNNYPNIAKLFTAFLHDDRARRGIELAAKYTTPKKTDSEVAVTSAPGTCNLRANIEMNISKPGEIILPVPGQNNILVTSALPYINNVPHLGNIVGCVLSADVFSRYSKARNRNTLFVCGTDEYGTATETKALEENITPQELCDKYHKIHKEIYDWFEIGFDTFGRTATEKQTEICQDAFVRCWEQGFLEVRSKEQPYCNEHKAFLADRFIEGTCPDCNYDDARGDQCDSCGHLIDAKNLKNPRCKIDGSKPSLRETKHIGISLQKLQPEIEAWYKKSSTEGAWSQNSKSITEQWFKQGLEPRDITRDLKWGVPVPVDGFRDKVVYVWFDAPLGYVSITANYTEKWTEWWKNPDNVKLYQFMGKDNTPFHSAGLILTTLLILVEYLNYEGGKFSKSRNVGVFGNNAKETGIPSSIWRYYLLSSRPETSDSMFTWKTFIAKNNSELLANVGNLVNRVIKFVNAKYDGVVPEFSVQGETISILRTDVARILKDYIEAMEAVKIRHGLELAMELSSRGNLYLQENKMDNNLFRQQPQKCAQVVGVALNLIYLLSACIYPFLPSTAQGMVDQLNTPLRTIPMEWTVDIMGGHKIGKAEYLFSRIDEKKEDQWKAKYGTGTSAKKEQKLHSESTVVTS
ncbi:putative methionine--tRNA ligase, cytoplasmic [Neolecta irregularis DAH-3]|uniref:methionine--tRNA ligase n=1 Tax=Neolecta irregularis (strain DAH-3) TaxID=1198029 RepID=A0A1U7LVU7_NEOID|nr:putative methionine--tRNA ligase, cytoplasmic [Neolecta irregularis DAH-3]|eukprot:OLL26806.1 putative methionine--tRNA ligase, cytoplasmic [Neolecta irregularis DAH-3]